MFGDELHALLHQRQHPQGQEVDLDEAGVVHRVLVPLAEHPPGHGRRHHRHQFHQRARGDDHPAHVLRNVAGEAVDLAGQGHQIAPGGSVHLVVELRQAGHLLAQVTGSAALAALGQLVQLGFGQAQGLADVADGASDLVGGKRAHQGGVLRAELVVDPQDQLLPDVPREVQVDVRHRGHLLVEEAAQEELVLEGIDVGQADEVADEGAHRRATASPRRQAGPSAGGVLPPNLLRHLTAEFQQVAVDEEETRETVLVHQRQFLLQAGLHLRRDAAVSLAGGLVAQLP